MKRLILAPIAALLLAAATAAPATAGSAGDPGNVWNASASQCNVNVYNVSGQPGATMKPGAKSSNYATWNHHVRYFKIVGSDCKGHSQFSPAGSNPYLGEKTYWTNGIDPLVITAYRYI